MKKIYLIPALVIAVAPFSASAHQHAIYTIDGSTYQFVIGSLNEPISVDDKTGVDLTVTMGKGMPTMSADGEMDGMPAGAAPVTGLENSLKVELIAGEHKKVLALSPVYGKAGSYSAAFYPTVATTISYRIFGAIGSTPIDVQFTCVPEGTAKVADDMKKVEVSDGVMRVMSGGAFTCPRPKETLGFPERSASLDALRGELNHADTSARSALGLGAAGLALSVVALVRRRR